ncbi:DUF4625 domain-containing protein [Marinifilum sp. D714]|uniref:DUF4625 domain-containing protein n=1 Tax=Marinifilum sp. D714 TaxID=2937523 RepID=UPI0027BB59E9|nr:DUF4625 domain-containing protein [Marinifilum sp. D714]MDQ2178011.1 DUF4625 domain-containing protein [Marinifilum sp. D714]
MKIVNQIICLFIGLALFACGSGGDDSVDGTNPSITLNSPTEATTILPGSVLKVSASLSDDIGLEEYVLTISAGGTKSVKNVEEFSFNSYTDTDAYGNSLPAIKGMKSTELSFDIGIADNARAGFYTFTLSVKDQAGNGSEETLQLEISRP